MNTQWLHLVANRSNL